MIELKNLTKTYKTKKGVITNALNGVTVNFGNKGLVFILGKSGSGKTTLLNLLGGIDQATEGEIVINGKSTKDFTSEDYDGYRNTYVGSIFQEYNLLDTYSVKDNILLATELQGKKTELNKLDEALRAVDLVDAEGKTLDDRRINELSGGQNKE